jgi:hypothetical protein
MPALALFLAGGLAVVVTAGTVLDKLNARRSRRVLVWSALFLLPFLLFGLLVVFVLLMLMLGGPFKWPC